MNRIFFSVLTIVAALGAVAAGTGAFFSDTETASGNTFAAGVIDLLVDNESYYNGNVCVDIDETDGEDWRWQGSAAYPEPGTPCTTSWYEDNLDGHLFFDFTDLKPDDEGEDTISLHVNNNDAWACMNVSLTANDDASSTEPELATGDDPEDEDNAWDGELAQAIEFVWWADDGDNVFEDDELVLSDGVETLYDLATTSGSFSVALADSVTNVWTGVPGPIPADEIAYVGKAWCLGTLTLDAVAAGDGVSPSVASGVICDGTDLGNELQSDRATLDVSFFTLQARHDSDYRCPEPEEIVACTVDQSYVDSVYSTSQGSKRNGDPVDLARSDTSSVFGPPHITNTGDVDAGIPVGTFYSLGFPNGGEASIVLSFDDNAVIDGPGADLQLYEVTNGAYPDEAVRVEVSNSPVGPWMLAAASVERNALVDLAPAGVGMAWRYVKLTDVTDVADFPVPLYDIADGYDLDAARALNCVVSPVQ